MAKAPGGWQSAGRGWAAKRVGLDGQLGGTGGKSAAWVWVAKHAAWGWVAKRAGLDGQQGGTDGKSAARGWAGDKRASGGTDGKSAA